MVLAAPTNNVTPVEAQILTALRGLMQDTGFGTLEIVVRDRQIVHVTKHIQVDVDKMRRSMV